MAYWSISRQPISASLRHALVTQGVPPPPKELLYSYIGPPLLEALREILIQQNADPNLAKACVKDYREHYRHSSIRDTKLFPGIEMMVKKLSQHIPLAVATSKPAEFAVPILETLGLANYFQAIVGPPLNLHAEAKADTVARALAKQSSNGGSEVVMIGDRLHDMQAAAAHALTGVGVSWGIGSVEELKSAGAHHIVETPAQLHSLSLF